MHLDVVSCTVLIRVGLSLDFCPVMSVELSRVVLEARLDLLQGVRVLDGW